MMTETTSCIPNSRQFKAWLQAALPMVGVTPYTASGWIGKGRNAVSTFLKTDGRGILMDRAAMLEGRLREVAAEKSIKLPPVHSFASGIDDA